MTAVLAQWSRRGRRLLPGPHAAGARDAVGAVAAIPALGPVPPLLVRARLAPERQH